MDIAIVTDEISSDVQTAIELGLEWGVNSFELRGYGTDRVPIFTPYQKNRIEELLDEFDIQVVAISPGLFKCPFPVTTRERFSLSAIDKTLYEQWRQPRDVVRFHLQELLPLSIEYAQSVGAKKIVAFSFERHEVGGVEAPDEVLLAIQSAAKQCAEANLDLVIEVEAGFWADTGANTAAMMQAIAHPSLGVNWDPGNAIVAGDVPFPTGYAAVHDYVRHVHFKDVSFGQDGGHRYVIEGEIDWAGQISALAEDGYAGYISVETHMEPKVSSAMMMTDRLRNLLDHHDPGIESDDLETIV